MIWPAPARDAALHGIAGEFVTRTAPHTESDPMALLTQFLVSFGAAAGRNVHYPVEATHHHLNEYAILIGPSGKGRKGSAWDHVEALISDTDSTFAERCISSGLASGEGLIFEVRDPSPGDSGSSDKRRLIIESEFAQILKVLAREGNTLSPVLRNAWDGKPLQTIAKNAPVRATNTHVAIIGHITKDELLRFVSGTELANGFVNRFLLVAVRRSQELPFGGRLQGEQLERVRETTHAALRFASQPRQLAFDPEARERWIAVSEVFAVETRIRPESLGLRGSGRGFAWLLVGEAEQFERLGLQIGRLGVLDDRGVGVADPDGGLADCGEV